MIKRILLTIWDLFVEWGEYRSRHVLRRGYWY